MIDFMSRIYVKNECIIAKMLRNMKQVGDCWEWTAGVDDCNYGNILFEKKNIKVHRLSYLLFKGPLESGKYICHSCDNPRCFNPNHLWQGTPKENTNDCITKNRFNIRKLTPEQVLEIRKSKGIIDGPTLSKMYNIDEFSIYKILHNKTYKDVWQNENNCITKKKLKLRKLTSEQVVDIKKSKGIVTAIELAKKHCVSYGVIYQIWKNRNYNEINI